MQYQQIEELRKELQYTVDRRKKAEIAIAMCEALLRRDIARAREYGRRALTYAEELGDPSLIVQARTYIAETLWGTGEFAECREEAERAIALCEAEGIDGSLLAGAIAELGTAWHGLGRYPESIETFDRAIEIVARGEDKALLGKILGSKGSLLRAMGEYSRALELMMRGLELVEKEKPEWAPVILSSIGVVYRELRQSEQALVYFERSLALCRAQGNLSGCAQLLINIGGVYIDDDDASPALPYMLEAVEVNTALGRKRSVASALMGVGMAYGRMYDNAQALIYFHRSLDMRRELGDETGCGQMQIHIGEVHMDNGDYEVAEPWLLQGLEIVTRQGFRSFEMRGNKYLARTLEALGKFEQALGHLRRYTDLRAELESQETGRAIARVEMQLDIEKAERERQVFALKAEQLEREMEFKSRELASMALNLAQQSELVASLREEFLPLRKDAGIGVSQLIDRLMERLRSHEGVEQSWESFERQFQSVHPGFMKQLVELCPKLTPMELKICALMRLSLSSKQIASILCASVRTVDNHRLHVRQKLELGADVNLSTYLASL